MSTKNTSKHPSQRRYPPELRERAVRMVGEAIAEGGESLRQGLASSGRVPETTVRLLGMRRRVDDRVRAVTVRALCGTEFHNAATFRRGQPIGPSQSE